MIALIKKDISLNLRSLAQSTAVATIIVLVFSRMESGVAFITVWSMMIPYSYALMSCYSEELNKGLVFCRSLPVSPCTIVWSKFAGSLVVTLASGAYVTFLGALASRMGWLTSVKGFSLAVAVIAPWIALFVIQGVLFLLFFTRGYKRAQSVVSVLPLVFLVPLVLPVSLRSRVTSFLDRVSGVSLNANMVICLLAAIGLFVDAVLTWRAAKAFEKKDLT